MSTKWEKNFLKNPVFVLVGLIIHAHYLPLNPVEILLFYISSYIIKIWGRELHISLNIPTQCRFVLNPVALEM